VHSSPAQTAGKERPHARCQPFTFAALNGDVPPELQLCELTIQGYDEDNEKFRIQARSHSVSGHGG